MADVITRLRVESSEFDNKLKHASEQFQRMEENARRTGASIAYANKEEIEFIKSLGSMETKATSAKGKLAELTKEFTDLSIRYKKWDEATKQSDAGKAMASSLERLKVRINEAQTELRGIQGELGGTGNVLDVLAGKIGVPTELLTKMGLAAAAVGGAMKVATDAFKQDEEMMDSWKATTEAASSVYQGFLNALNTGDISGFLTRIGQIASAAQEAYNALDQLGTFNAFNQINVQKAQTRFTEAYAGYRSGESTKSDVQQAAENWKNELETRRKLEQEAYLAKIREIAASRGVDAESLTKALSGSYGDYRTLREVPIETESVYNSQTRSFEDRRKSVQSDAALLGETLRKLNDTELANLQTLGAQAERTATEIAQIDKQVARVLTKKDPTANTPKADVAFAEGSIAAQEKLISDLQKKWKEAADDDSRAKIKTQIEAATAELDRMIGKVKTSMDAEAKAVQTLAVAQERLKEAMQGNDLKTIVSAEADVDKALKALNDLRAAKPENQKAVFTVEVNDEELQKLQQLKTDDQTIRVNVEQGEVSLPDMPEKTYIVTIEAETADAVSTVDAAVAEMNAEKVIIPVEVQEVDPVKVDVSYTEANMQAFISSIRQQIAEADMGSELYNNLTSKLADATAMSNLIKTAIQNGIDVATIDPQAMWQQIGSGNIDLGVDVSDEAWQKLVDEINTQLATLNLPPIELDVKTGSVKAASNDVVKMKGDWTQAAQAVAAFGSALQSVEDPTAKVAGIIAEAIASVAAGAGGAIANAAKGDAGGPWGWLAFAISATATMVSTIAAIRSATSTGNYASGGIIPGTSFSGDRLTANVNSGELILNRAQQDRIAGQLTAGSGVMGGAQISQPYVTGEKILLGVNNYLGRSGQGEIVTTGMLRRAGINL